MVPHGTALQAALRTRAAQRALILFPGNALWHERLILAHVILTRYVIYTPDGDVYTQDFAELAAVRMVPSGGGRPAGVNRR